jgi:hypothetical protein
MPESVDTVAPVCTEPAQNSESPGSRRCGAKLRGKDGKTCNQWGIAPSGRCRLHGGASPRGSDHPSFVTGAYSRELPKSLRKDFLRFVNDPELISARTELAVLRTRLLALSGRVETGETADAWLRLRDQLAKAKAACEERDIDAVRAALAPAIEVTTSANETEAAWHAYVVLCERFTAIAAREARRLVDAKLMCSAETVHTIVHSIAAIVLREVRDTRTRAVIAEAIQRLRLLGRDELDELSNQPEPDHGNTTEATA